MKNPPNLKAYFGFTKMPFTKYMWTSKMFNTSCQKKLLQGLGLWLQAKEITLMYGPVRPVWAKVSASDALKAISTVDATITYIC